jgi:hypothetical protein
MGRSAGDTMPRIPPRRRTAKAARHRGSPHITRCRWWRVPRPECRASALSGVEVSLIRDVVDCQGRGNVGAVPSHIGGEVVRPVSANGLRGVPAGRSVGFTGSGGARDLSRRFSGRG